MVDGYYLSLLGTAPTTEAMINLDSLGLPSYDLTCLEEPFSMTEVEKIVKLVPLDESLDLDGFTGRFYVTCWQIIIDDFMRALDHFYCADMRGMATTNKALVSLLPKVVGAVDIKDF